MAASLAIHVVLETFLATRAEHNAQAESRELVRDGAHQHFLLRTGIGGSMLAIHMHHLSRHLTVLDLFDLFICVCSDELVWVVVVSGAEELVTIHTAEI